MRRTIQTVAVLAVLGASTAPSAQLLRLYDANRWTGSNLVDQVGGTVKLTPGAGTPRVVASPPLTADDFGAPVFVASGAGPRSRAYLDFQKVGVLTGSPDSGSSFNVSTSTPQARGYTLELYFKLSTGYTVTENTGVGFSQSTSVENQCIRIGRGINQALSSQTQTANLLSGAPDYYRHNTANIDALVPRNQWVHLVKVHDPMTNNWQGAVRYYVNGTLAGTYTTWTETGAGATNVYRARGEGLGNVGAAGREISKVGYSLFRMYRGALTAVEIQANYRAVAVAPPPGAVVLIR